MATDDILGKHYEDFIKTLIESGRYASAGEVMRESLRLLEEKEQQRLLKLESLRAAIQEGLDGPFEDIHPSDLIARVKARGRERLKD